MNFAVNDFDNALGIAGNIFFMGNQNNGAVQVAVELGEQFHNFDTHLGIEVTGRLVGKNNRRIVDNGAGNRHTLLLAAGKLIRLVIHLSRR